MIAHNHCHSPPCVPQSSCVQWGPNHPHFFAAVAGAAAGPVVAAAGCVPASVTVCRACQAHCAPCQDGPHPALPLPLRGQSPRPPPLLPDANLLTHRCQTSGPCASPCDPARACPAA
eukprot:scaffold31482_cov16-Tisochrysis_lutea.AAC.1